MMHIKFILGMKNISSAVVTLQLALHEDESSVRILKGYRKWLSRSIPGKASDFPQEGLA